MITKIQKGHPATTKEKRILRIQEALAIPLGSKEIPNKYVIDTVHGEPIFFLKPGKEYFRISKQNPNDMTPYVGDLYTNYSFGDIWKDLLNLAIRLNEDQYKRVLIMLYRSAYLLDCVVKQDGLVRFQPNEEMQSSIQEIQGWIDKVGYKFKLIEFLYFIDLLAWNEDVKYQVDMIFSKPRVGRINTILSLISIPLIFKEFVELVIDNQDNLENLDYSMLIDVAQQFARSRGVQPISNVKLANFLEPYLI